jgi:RNA polymerase subunit RPABC4/transcription elongation factor Spt4
VAEGEDVKMPNHKGFAEKIRDNWERRASEKTTLQAELRIIPRRVIQVLCALYLVALGAVFWITVSTNVRPFDISVEPLWLELLGVFGVLTAIAIVGSAFVMLVAYVACDAGRRGMSPVLWVLIAFLLPYFIGIVLYFVVREPLSFSCPRCGAAVAPQFNFCPACRVNLRPNCPHCRMAVRAGDRFCPSCGSPLHSDTPAPASAAEVSP